MPNIDDKINTIIDDYKPKTDDDDDDDDDDDEEELFLWYGWLRKGVYQRSSPLQISDMPRRGFEPAQNLSPGLVEWSCAVVITTTPWHHTEYENRDPIWKLK